MNRQEQVAITVLQMPNIITIPLAHISPPILNSALATQDLKDSPNAHSITMPRQPTSKGKLYIVLTLNDVMNEAKPARYTDPVSLLCFEVCPYNLAAYDAG